MKAVYGAPRPLLSLLLLLVWLLLSSDLSAGSVILGLVLAWIIPLMTRPLWSDEPAIRKPWRIFRYLRRLLWDIFLANLTVARLVLNARRQPKPAFVSYPLSLEHPLAITILASTITLTPGTVGADISADRKLLLIHALDIDDDQALINSIRERYEIPLQEMFP